MRIARFTTGDDPSYGLVEGAGEYIAEITGDPLYQPIELTGTCTRSTTCGCSRRSSRAAR